MGGKGENDEKFDMKQWSTMKWAAVLVALLVISLVIFWTVYPSVTLRYRLTLETESNNQLKIGSGVIQVSAFRNIVLILA
jgi:membrane protein YdbS with pleckstrin-like domain